MFEIQQQYLQPKTIKMGVLVKSEHQFIKF